MKEKEPKKKIKKWKKIMLIIIATLIIILAIILRRWNILREIQNKYEISNQNTNYYYYSESSNTIIEYWKKDGIIKMNTRQVNGEGNLTFWKNEETGEDLIFWNSPKKLYSKNKGGILENLPNGMMFTNQENIRILMAAMPNLFIKNIKYEGKECYLIEINGEKECIEKGTGLILFSQYGEEDNSIRKIKYEFNNVEDENIQKPDISQYEYIE